MIQRFRHERRHRPCTCTGRAATGRGNATTGSHQDHRPAAEPLTKCASILRTRSPPAGFVVGSIVDDDRILVKIGGYPDAVGACVAGRGQRGQLPAFTLKVALEANGSGNVATGSIFSIRSPVESHYRDCTTLRGLSTLTPTNTCIRRRPRGPHPKAAVGARRRADHQLLRRLQDQGGCAAGARAGAFAIDRSTLSRGAAVSALAMAEA